MKRRLFVPIIIAGVAAASGVASANPTYWRQNGLLLEVSADPRDGTDFVQTNPTHATRLELVALNDNVRLRGVTVRFADGRTFTQQMNTIRPGERVMVQLPANCGVIQGVELDYGRQRVDRTAARLQIIPHQDAPIYAQPQRPTYPRQRDHRRYASDQYGYYQQREPSYYQSQPSYRVEPRVTWSGSVQGSFRF